MKAEEGSLLMWGPTVVGTRDQTLHDPALLTGTPLMDQKLQGQIHTRMRKKDRTRLRKPLHITQW